MRLIEVLRDALPFLFLLGIIIGLAIWVQWALGKYWQIMVETMEGFQEKLRDIKRCLSEVERNLAYCKREYQGAVIEIAKDIQKLEGAIIHRNPIDAIVAEQKGLNR